MATETLTELELFHRFLGEQIARGNKRISVAQGLELFQAYRRDIEKLKEALRPALEQYERGEGGPIDWDKFFREGEERLRAKGISG